MPVVATNRYGSAMNQAGLATQPTRWRGPLTKSDSDELVEYAKGILVLDTGDVTLVDAEGGTTTFTLILPMFIPGFFKQLKSSGTTATKVYAGS